MTDESKNALKRLLAAIGTLEDMGYTYTEGTERWRPPIGKKPECERPGFFLELSAYLRDGEQRVIKDSDFDSMKNDADLWRQFKRLACNATFVGSIK